MSELKELSELISNLKTPKEVLLFLNEILTENEISTLSKRWRILNMLNKGFSQRAIAHDLSVSLCKITRGAKILKNKNAITTKFLTKEKNNDKYTS